MCMNNTCIIVLLQLAAFIQYLVISVILASVNDNDNDNDNAHLVY